LRFDFLVETTQSGWSKAASKGSRNTNDDGKPVHQQPMKHSPSFFLLPFTIVMHSVFQSNASVNDYT
jgi:hypothetical protein